MGGTYQNRGGGGQAFVFQFGGGEDSWQVTSIIPASRMRPKNPSTNIILVLHQPP